MFVLTRRFGEDIVMEEQIRLVVAGSHPPSHRTGDHHPG
jgi:sRNA-binding carbon storage regulator CsrA